MSSTWTDEEKSELFVLLRACMGALVNIGDQLEKIAAQKAPPSSKRGKS